MKIYSKSDEQCGKGNPMVNSVVRIEQTLRNLNLKVVELKKLTNPFSKIVLVEHCPVPPPWERAGRWIMFQDCVRVRGLTAALAQVPPARRTKYRKHIKQYQSQWWTPEAIWKGWPATVDDLL